MSPFTSIFDLFGAFIYYGTLLLLLTALWTYSLSEMLNAPIIAQSFRVLKSQQDDQHSLKLELAKIDLEKAKVEMEMAKENMKAQMEMEKLSMERETNKAKMDIETATSKAQLDMQQETLENDIDLEYKKFQAQSKPETEVQELKNEVERLKNQLEEKL
ncbi:92749436-eb3f-4d46-995d-a4324c447e28-CDS [Sclerotinia trifoliorum]|uniref:92749436-eb3f-4d46-995d-a4324c447e28-CDS n=1 Tax=Sclerotinia trifoliorum TaxID=28548 RepID=A0A8H2VNE9_9HELO|nr:92749436-eb3f-4d46-995d-a4324c447e28-CDS [Sclerotinia trifoliorum]